MKRQLLLLALVFFYITTLFSQSSNLDLLTVEHAIKLSAELDDNTWNSSKAVAILDLYFGSQTDSLLSDNDFKLIDNKETLVNSTKIDTDFSTNLFLKRFSYSETIESDKKKEFFNTYEKERMLIFNTVDKTKFARFSEINVTNASKGVSQFLISRAKNELNVAFFQKFKKFLEKHQELQILFPNTVNAIDGLLEINYTEMLPTLQVAFNKDMEVMPENIIEVFLTTEYWNRTSEFPEIYLVINMYNLLKQINVLNPAEIIDLMPSVVEKKDGNVLKPEYGNLYNSLKIIKVFSNALRQDSASNPKQYWISASEFNQKVLSNEKTLQVFMGLVLQQMKNENITINGKSIEEIIKNNDIETELLWYNTQLFKMINQIEKVNSVTDKTYGANDFTLKSSQIYDYTEIIIDLVDFGFDVANHYFPDGGLEHEEYIKIARELNNMFINTRNEKYSLAMKNLIELLTGINQIAKERKQKDLINPRLLSNISVYGTFVANVASAESPEEIKAALEAAALPTGSSSYKKYNSWNVALNGYVGVAFVNNAIGVDTSTVDSWYNKVRVTAPIGITLTPLSMGNSGSVSFFVSAFDVGALVDYYLTESDELEQQIYLSNILSPGFYVTYGFAWNLPLALGAGFQYGPGLVKVGTPQNNSGWKFNVTLTVDIPVFNLWKGNQIK